MTLEDIADVVDVRFDENWRVPSDEAHAVKLARVHLPQIEQDGSGPRLLLLHEDGETLEHRCSV